MVAGVAVMVLVVAACAIKLRDDEDQTSSASSASPDADPLAAGLARCRRVTPEQTDALELGNRNHLLQQEPANIAFNSGQIAFSLRRSTALWCS